MRITGNRRESGIVLIAVVFFVVVASVLIMGIMGRNVSNTLAVERQIRHIQAEQLRKGALWIAKARADQNQTVAGTIVEDMGPGEDFYIHFSKKNGTLQDPGGFGIIVNY